MPKTCSRYKTLKTFTKQKLKTVKLLSNIWHITRKPEIHYLQSAKNVWNVHLWPNHDASQKCKGVYYFILCTEAKVHKEVSRPLQWRTRLDKENRLSAKEMKTIATDGTPSKTKAIPQIPKLHSPSIWLWTHEENGSGWKLQNTNQGSAKQTIVLSSTNITGIKQQRNNY